MLMVLSRNKVFFILWMLALIGASILVCNYSNYGLQVVLNQFHSPFFDTFFFYLTKLAEGILAVLLLLFALTKSKAHIFSLLLAWCSATLFTQSLKKLVFNHIPRPAFVFQDYANWHWVEGVKLNYFASFPSGHTTEIFVLMTVWALWSKNNYIGVFAFCIAALVAYSRVYLSQHFMLDLIAGSTVGVFFSCLSVFVFFHSTYASNKANWLQMPVLSKSKK